MKNKEENRLNKTMYENKCKFISLILLIAVASIAAAIIVYFFVPLPYLLFLELIIVSLLVAGTILLINLILTSNKIKVIARLSEYHSIEE
jgi:membrane protein YdbS with pleckstrin-like domain